MTRTTYAQLPAVVRNGRELTIHREPLRLPALESSGGPRIWPFVGAGLCVMALFFGGLVGWSVHAPLSSAALATGHVAIDTNRKRIQHLEGGIVRRIMVREGQKIEAGHVLLVLDDTQVRAKIERLRAGIHSTSDQLRLVEDELGSIQNLYKQGYARKSRLMAFRRKQRELQGRLQQDRAELQASQDVVERLEIRAPMSGTVVGLRVHTRGGVIAPGAELLSIVPEDELLVIEARINPNDIDVVHAGLGARVRLTPFSARLMSPLPGRVVSVSADRMIDEQTREGYYLARIELEKDPKEEADGAKLYPGMPVEVTIVTGVRTLLDYILNPLIQSFGRAFRES